MRSCDTTHSYFQKRKCSSFHLINQFSLPVTIYAIYAIKQAITRTMPINMSNANKNKIRIPIVIKNDNINYSPSVTTVAVDPL